MLDYLQVYLFLAKFALYGIMLLKNINSEAFCYVNSNTFSNKCEENFLNFSKLKINGYNKINSKFCSQMINGIIKSSSVVLSDAVLSEIVRKNDLNIDVNIDVNNSMIRFSRL